MWSECPERTSVLVDLYIPKSSNYPMMEEDELAPVGSVISNFSWHSLCIDRVIAGPHIIPGYSYRGCLYRERGTRESQLMNTMTSPFGLKGRYFLEGMVMRNLRPGISPTRPNGQQHPSVQFPNR